MKKFLIPCVALLVVSTSITSCISTSQYNEVADKAKKFEMLLEKERKENSALTDEKYSLEDFSKGKSTEISKIQQKSQEAIDVLTGKYTQLQSDYKKLVEANKKLAEDLKNSELILEAIRQESTRQVADLENKLRWVYVKYNVKRSASN